MGSSGTRRLHRVNPVVSWGCPDTLGLFRVFGEMKGRGEKTRGFVELTKSRLVSKWGFTVKNVKMVRNIKFVNSVLCMRTYS